MVDLSQKTPLFASSIHNTVEQNADEKSAYVIKSEWYHQNIVLRNHPTACIDFVVFFGGEGVLDATYSCWHNQGLSGSMTLRLLGSALRSASMMLLLCSF